VVAPVPAPVRVAGLRRVEVTYPDHSSRHFQQGQLPIIDALPQFSLDLKTLIPISLLLIV